LKSSLEVPLVHISGVRADPQVAHGWYHGVRLPGTNVPGVITAGTFYQDGKRVFWDVHHPDKTIVIDLHDERYNELIVEVDDPAGAVQLIQSALRKPGAPGLTALRNLGSHLPLTDQFIKLRDHEAQRPCSHRCNRNCACSRRSQAYRRRFRRAQLSFPFRRNSSRAEDPLRYLRQAHHRQLRPRQQCGYDSSRYNWIRAAVRYTALRRSSVRPWPTSRRQSVLHHRSRWNRCRPFQQAQRWAARALSALRL